MTAVDTSALIDLRTMGYLKSRDRSDDAPTTAAVVLFSVADQASLDAMADVDAVLDARDVDVDMFFGTLADAELHLSAGTPAGLAAGGGQRPFDLAAYVLARRISIDCYERRDEKGHAVFVADTAPAADALVDVGTIRDVLGDIVGQMTVGSLFDEMQERWKLAVIIPPTADPDVTTVWQKLGAEALTSDRPAVGVVSLLVG